MKTDRELLELAAKAMSIPVMGWTKENGIERADGGWWDPFDDICDCLEIPHELGFEILFTQQAVTVCEIGEMVFLASEATGGYPHLSLMRAIVRAAAYIGEQMK